MDCKCESCVRENCQDRTKQDDLRIVIGCEDYLKSNTNADRIRAMSDEELAEVVDCPKGLFDRMECFYTDRNCEDCILEWLKQPAEEVPESGA